MNVDFNNLRKQGAYAYDRLVKKLNRGIGTEEYIPNDDRCLVSIENIQQDMDDLRSIILTIACVQEEKNERFRDVSDEIEKSGGVDVFNPDLDS